MHLWIKKQKGIDLTKSDLPFNPKHRLLIKANKSGYLKWKSTAQIGNICKDLGAGRIKKADKIDFQAGIYLMKKIGDYVKVNEIIAIFYSSTVISIDTKQRFIDNIVLANEKNIVSPIVAK